MTDAVRVDGVHKWVQAGDQRIPILQGVSLHVQPSDFVAIMGPSGCGKSTLLHLIGLLDSPSSGRIYVGGRETTALGDAEQTRLRAGAIGFVFQSFHLLPYLTAEENVLLPMRYAGRDSDRERARQLLALVRMEHRAQAYPATLSGGERQRVAVARAIVNSPSILLADEPTGSLDSRTGRQILDLLASLNKTGMTILMVTHDEQVARRARRTLHMQDGVFV